MGSERSRNRSEPSGAPPQRRWALPAAALAVGIAAGASVVAVVWAMTSTASRPLSQQQQSVRVGSVQVPVLPDQPAVLAGPRVAKVIAPIRSAVKAAPLTQLPCLDRVAAGYAQEVAAALAAATTPPTRPAAAAGPGQRGCNGRLVTGYVLGPDSTGLSQARVSYGNANGDPRQPSGLLDKRSTSVGYGLAAERVKGRVVGYVFGWAVTS